MDDAAIDAFLASRPDTSRRVTLRRLTRGDQDEFLDLVRASAELHGRWISLPATPEQYRTYLARYSQSDEEALLICERGSAAIAGVINVNSVVRGRFQSASVAYAAFAPAAGQGYMTEGLLLVVRYAFEQLLLHRLEAQIQPDNHASLKLVQRVGFRREGYSPELLYIDGAWRDHERWAITNTMIDIAPPPAHPTLPAR